jgi:hypothetical protein
LVSEKHTVLLCWNDVRFTNGQVLRALPSAEVLHQDDEGLATHVWPMFDTERYRNALARPYVIFYCGIAGADLGFCRLVGPGGDLRSWLRWLRRVEAERDRLAEQVEYAALFRGRC